MKRGMKSINNITSLGGKAPIQVTRMIRYAISGGLTVFIDLIILITLVELVRFYYIYAAVIGFTVAHTVHYSINRVWGFKESRKNYAKGYFYFLFFGAVSATMIAYGLKTLVEIAGINYIASRVMIMAFLGVLNFTLNYTISFGMGKELFSLFKKSKKK